MIPKTKSFCTIVTTNFIRLRTLGILFLIHLIAVNSVRSQQSQYVARLDTIKKIGSIYPLYNKSSAYFPLIITSADSIHSLLISKDDNTILSMNHEILNRSGIKELLNYSSSDNDYYLLFMSKLGKKFGLIIIANSRKKILESEITFNKNEEYVVSHFYNDAYYILTLRINTSELYLYRYSADSEFIDKSIIDVSQHYTPDNLYETIACNDPGDYSVEVSTIYEENTQNLVTLALKNKLYRRNDKLIMLIGNHDNSSEILTIDLDDFATELSNFKYPELICKPHKYRKFNSAIIDSLLFQLYACSKQLSLTITDIYNPANSKTYTCDKKSLNEFKHGFISNSNTEYMYQSGPDVTSDQLSIQFLKKFLKVALESDLYISLNEYSDKWYNLTIGTLNEKYIYQVPIFYNPYFYGFVSYSEYFKTIRYQISRSDLSIHELSSGTYSFPEEIADLNYVSKNTVKYGNYYLQYDKENKSIKIFPKPQ